MNSTKKIILGLLFFCIVLVIYAFIGVELFFICGIPFIVGYVIGKNIVW